MQTTKTAKTTKQATAQPSAAPAQAPAQAQAQAPAQAPAQASTAKAHAQWCNTTSTKRVYGYAHNTPVVPGLPNTAKPGSARHAAIAAMQACATMGAVYAIAATNWVHWAVQNRYIVPQVATTPAK